MLLLALLVVGCEAETPNPEAGRPAGASSNEAANAGAANAGAANAGAASAPPGELVAQKSFNDGTETLFLYDLGGGSFGARWEGNPKGGHSVLAQAFMGLKLSEVWELVAAPGQEPSPALASLMTAHPARSNTLATLESQLAAPAPAETATSSIGVAPETIAATTNNNYCNNGGFFNDFGVNSQQNGGWLYQAPLQTGLNEPANVLQYLYRGKQFAISYSQFGLAATAVCPTNDAGFFVSFNVPAGTGDGYKVWSTESCGFDATCCFTTGCNSCTIPGTSFTWTWVDGCPPDASGNCNDGNVTGVVTYEQFLKGGCAQ